MDREKLVELMKMSETEGVGWKLMAGLSIYMTV